jgi:hypothetical protein
MIVVNTSGLQMDSTEMAGGYFGREAALFHQYVSCRVTEQQPPFRSPYCYVYVHNLESCVRVLSILQEETPYFLFFGGGI